MAFVSDTDKVSGQTCHYRMHLPKKPTKPTISCVTPSMANLASSIHKFLSMASGSMALVLTNEVVVFMLLQETWQSNLRFAIEIVFCVSFSAHSSLWTVLAMALGHDICCWLQQVFSLSLWPWTPTNRQSLSQNRSVSIASPLTQKELIQSKGGERRQLVVCKGKPIYRIKRERIKPIAMVELHHV